MMGRMRDIAPLPGAGEGAEALERADRKAEARRGYILVATAWAGFAALYLLLLGPSGVFTLPKAVHITIVFMALAIVTAIVTTLMVLDDALRRPDRRLADLDGRVARVEGLVERGGRFGAADAPEPAPAAD